MRLAAMIVLLSLGLAVSGCPDKRRVLEGGLDSNSSNPNGIPDTDVADGDAPDADAGGQDSVAIGDGGPSDVDGSVNPEVSVDTLDADSDGGGDVPGDSAVDSASDGVVTTDVPDGSGPDGVLGDGGGGGDVAIPDAPGTDAIGDGSAQDATPGSDSTGDAATPDATSDGGNGDGTASDGAGSDAPAADTASDGVASGDGTAQPDVPTSDAQPDAVADVPPADAGGTDAPTMEVGDAGEPDLPPTDATSDAPLPDAEPDLPATDAAPDGPLPDAEPDLPPTDAASDASEPDAEPDLPSTDAPVPDGVDDTGPGPDADPPECVIDSDCTSNGSPGECQDWSCNAGTCELVQVPVGTPCDDLELCTQFESCDASGACGGGDLDCLNPACTTFPGCGSGPPTGNTCGDAIVIAPTALPAVIPGDTTSATNDLNIPAFECPAFGGGFMPGLGGGSNDLVYSFTPDTTGNYTIALTANVGTLDAALMVGTACPVLDATSCIEASDWFGVGGESITTNLLQGTPYFIVVDGYDDLGNVAGSFELTVTADTGGGGGDCASEQIVVDAVPYTNNGDTTNASQLTGISSLCPSGAPTGAQLGFETGQANEDIYFFTAPADDTYTFTLSGGFDVALAVTTQCPLTDGGQCLAASDTGGVVADVVQVPLLTGESVYVLADGWQTESGAYTLSIVGSGGTGGGACDGKTVDVGTLPWTTSNNTGFSDNATSVPANECPDGTPTGPLLTFETGTGPEHVYRFTAPAAGEYRATLDITNGADLALVVTTACPLTGGSCLVASDGSSAQEQVTFTLNQDDVVFVIVDGYNGASGTYDLLIESTASEVNCGDTIDDDLDGLTDCEDPDCDSQPTACIEDCTNGVDDDGDNAVDCADGSCTARPSCVPACGVADFIVPSTLPFDQLGQDSAAATDDTYIPAFTCPQPGGGSIGFDKGLSGGDVIYEFVPTETGEHGIRVWGQNGANHILAVLNTCPGSQVQPGECVLATDFGFTSEWLFIDLVANTTYYVLVDSAGLFNEQGGGYDFQIYKVGTETDCSNGTDDDGDTFVDCQDPDCFGPPSCGVETTCNDTMDNDDDSLTDCEDPDCAGIDGCPAGGGCTVDADIGWGDLGTPFTWDTTGATNDTSMPADTCVTDPVDRGQLAPERIFTFTPVQSGIFNIDVANISGDFTTYITTDCPLQGGGNCIDGLNNVGNDEGIAATLMAGTTYYIIVDGPTATSTATGQFELTVTLLVPF